MRALWPPVARDGQAGVHEGPKQWGPLGVSEIPDGLIGVAGFTTALRSRGKTMADEKKAEQAEKKEKKEKKGRKKEDLKKAGFAANIEEGLEAKPARLKLRFRKEGVPALMKELGLKNPLQVPKLEKIVVNMGLGEALANNKILESAVDQLGAITGQKPVVTRARKSIANFKLRQGQAIGAAVTLRSDRTCEFMDRLINV